MRLALRVSEHPADVLTNFAHTYREGEDVVGEPRGIVSSTV